jgi:hypothetical protein
MIGALAATSLTFTSTAAIADTPSGLADLVGARGSSGESQLLARGYYNHHTAPADDGVYSYWWNQSAKKCVRVLTSDGRYAKIKSVSGTDCGYNDDGSDAAAAAIGAAALLGVVALASKSHHKNDRDYDTQGTAEFERGYRDGLYNHTYYNYSRSDAYSNGYSAGVGERAHQTPYRGGYNYNAGYAPYAGYTDVVGKLNTVADSMLRQRGYAYLGKDDTGVGHERLYWNAAAGQCISVRTSGGAVSDVHSLRKRACR